MALTLRMSALNSLIRQINMVQVKKKGAFLALLIFSSIAWGDASFPMPDELPLGQTPCASCLALLDPPAAEQNSWHFLISPYLWGSSITGHVTIDHETVNTNIPFSQIFDDLDFAGQIHLEASHGPWAFMLDPTYIKLSQNIDAGYDVANFQSQMALVDTGVYYRIWSSLALAPSLQSTSLEAFAGARYFALDNSIDQSSLGTFDNNTQTISPIVGGRIKYDYMTKLHFWVRGDIGGCHVDGMNSTWSSTAGISYTVLRYMDLGVAYKVLQLNYSRPSFSMNTLLYGPMIGVGFHW